MGQKGCQHGQRARHQRHYQREGSCFKCETIAGTFASNLGATHPAKGLGAGPASSRTMVSTQGQQQRTSLYRSPARAKTWTSSRTFEPIQDRMLCHHCSPENDKALTLGDQNQQINSIHVVWSREELNSPTRISPLRGSRFVLFAEGVQSILISFFTPTMPRDSSTPNAPQPRLLGSPPLKQSNLGTGVCGHPPTASLDQNHQSNAGRACESVVVRVDHKTRIDSGRHGPRIVVLKAIRMTFKSPFHVQIPHEDILTFLFTRSRFAEHDPVYLDAKDPTTLVTLSQLRSFTRRLGYAFREQGIGISGPGHDVVLSYVENQVMVAPTTLGILCAGGIHSTCPKTATPFELARQMRLSQPKTLVCSERTKKSAIEAISKSQIRNIRLLIMDSHKLDVTDEDGRSIMSHQELQWTPITDVQELTNTTACLVFSSGTTGVPKGKSCPLTYHSALTVLQRRKLDTQKPRCKHLPNVSYSSSVRGPSSCRRQVPEGTGHHAKCSSDWHCYPDHGVPAPANASISFR